MKQLLRCNAVAVALMLTGAALCVQISHAADKYPYRPIRIVQGFSPGGVSDTLARIVGDKLGERLGQPIVVEARPGDVNCATSGIGTTNDLRVHLLNHMAGIKIMNIPYKGSGPSMNAALGNETPLSFAPLLPAIPHVQNKRLRALGMSSLKRNQALPEVPAIAEELPGYETVGFFSIVTYREVPKPVIEMLHREINAVLAMPAVQAQFTRLGLDVAIMTRREFGDYIENDAKKWTELVRKGRLVL